MTEQTRIEKKLYDLIKDIRINMLTTVEPTGSLHTVPMDSQKPDDNGEFWFFAEKSSRNTTNIAKNPQISLGFSNPEDQNYVTISGTATVVTDRAKIHARWTEDLTAWFPQGKDDPNIVLFHIKPERGEYWDSTNSVFLHLYGIAKAKLTGKPPEDMVDNKKVALG